MCSLCRCFGCVLLCALYKTHEKKDTPTQSSTAAVRSSRVVQVSKNETVRLFCWLYDVLALKNKRPKSKTAQLTKLCHTVQVYDVQYKQQQQNNNMVHSSKVRVRRSKGRRPLLSPSCYCIVHRYSTALFYEFYKLQNNLHTTLCPHKNHSGLPTNGR